MDDTHTHLPLSGYVSDSDRYKRFRQTANERCSDRALSILTGMKMHQCLHGAPLAAQRRWCVN